MEENKMMIVNGGKNVYCSVVAKSKEEKKKLFNALESCDALLNDMVGNEIELQDVYVEEVETVSKETGEITKKFRSILFDSEGHSYATGSYGIYNILKKIFSVYGLPDTWEEPIKVKVSKKPTKDGKQSLTLLLV